MQKETHRQFTHFLTLTVPLLISISVVGTLSADSGKPIRKDGLVQAIRINGFTTEELIDRVQNRGVDFSVTPEVEKELLDAGARPELIEACRKNYRVESGSATPPGAASASNATETAGSKSLPSKEFSGPPLTSSEVQTLLESGVPSDKVGKIVADRGVNFTLTEQITQDIRGAGGTPRLFNIISGHLVSESAATNIGSGAAKTTLEIPVPAKPGPSSAELAARAKIAEQYDDLVDKVTNSIDRNDPYGAKAAAEHAIELDPAKPTAYGLLGYVLMYTDHNYAEAERADRKAIENGGFAIFKVFHDHGPTLFSHTCTGSMFIGKQTVKFKADNGAHTFEASMADIKEAKKNGFLGLEFAAFHLKVKGPNGKVSNYNFAPLGSSYGTLQTTGNQPSQWSLSESGLIVGFLSIYKDGSGKTSVKP